MSDSWVAISLSPRSQARAASPARLPRARHRAVRQAPGGRTQAPPSAPTGPIRTGPITGVITGAITSSSTRPTSRTTQQTSRTAPTTGRTTAGRTFGSRADTPVLSPVDQLKVDLHRRLIERLDLEALEKITDEGVLIQQIRNAVVEFLRDETTPLSQAEREEVIEQIVYEVTGLGPIEPLFRDPSITDILVNGPKDIYVERKGKLPACRRASATTRTCSRSSTAS